MNCRCVRFYGERLAVAVSQGSIRIFDVRTPRLIGSFLSCVFRGRREAIAWR